MKKRLAIIRDVHCGVGDYGRAALWFNVYPEENVAALQVFSWEAAKTIIEAYGVSDVQKLDGKSCWVEEGGNMIKWIGPAKV